MVFSAFFKISARLSQLAHFVQCTVCGPWSGRFYFVMKFLREKQSFNTNETFQEFIDLFAFLSLISRFPDASEGGKIKLTNT